MAAALGIDIREASQARLLSPELQQQASRMRMRHALWESGTLLTDSDHGPFGGPYLAPRVQMRRTRVYTGTRECGSYNHHAQLAKFRGRYYFGWSNGIRNELSPGQRVMLAVSDDGVHWPEARCIVPGDVEAGVVQSCAGLLATADRLVLYCRTESVLLEPELPGMRRVVPARSRIDTYTSTDGRDWQPAEEGIITGTETCRAMIFEAPRLLRDGSLACGGFADGPVLYRWDPASPTTVPVCQRQPAPDADAVFHHGECSWYQTDNGTVIMFWRDEGQSLCLYVSSSADGGKTWTAPIPSDFPDSMSRIYADRLPDGRFYLIGNSYPHLLDRMHLMLSISDNGYEFQRMLTLVDEPTTQRTKGLLKNDGYQYPCALVDGNRLLVGYSINKEDMECGTVAIADL